jgi:hypothetical protein
MQGTLMNMCFLALAPTDEDVDGKQLFNIFKKATEKPLDFLKINVRERDVNRKFSRNFTDYFQIKSNDDNSDSE